MEFINQSENEFTDISSEEWREYTWHDYTKILIRFPLQLSVSKSGGHRIFDAQGLSHYIMPGWIHIEWKVKEGQPHFVK